MKRIEITEVENGWIVKHEWQGDTMDKPEHFFRVFDQSEYGEKALKKEVSTFISGDVYED